MMKDAAKTNYFRVAGVTLSKFCNRCRFLEVQRTGEITLPQLAGVTLRFYLRPADISVTTLTFLRPAISSAMAIFSASDNTRGR